MADLVEPVDRRGPLGARRLLTLVAVVAGLAAALQLLQVGALPEVVPLPALGDVEPAVLEDGTPVWVNHNAPGSVQILHAMAPETRTPTEGTPGTGVVGLVAWCPRGERFIEPHHGATYSPEGRRYQVRIPGRLSRDAQRGGDLVLQEGGRIAGGRVVGDPVEVGQVVLREPIEGLMTPVATGRQSFGPPGECVLPGRRLVQSTPPLEPEPGDEPVDHSAFAETLDLAAGDGWQVVSGAVVVDADGSALLCADAPTQDPPVCAVPVEVQVALGLDEIDTGGSWAVLSGPLALRLEDRTVRQVGVLFTTQWTGSSLRGGFSYDAQLDEVLLERSAVVLRPPPSPEPDCVGRAPRPNQHGSIQFVGLDTRFDVAGITDPLELAEADGVRGTDVTITVDAATCRALLVRSRSARRSSGAD